MTDYKQYYDEKFMQGITYQDKVIEKLYEIGLPVISYSSREYQCKRGENKIGIEIKYTSKFRQTGYFYIEIAEKSDPNKKSFFPSGIYRRDNTWLYIMGDDVGFYIFSKYQLQKCYESGDYYQKRQIATSQGFLLSVENAKKFYIIKEVNF